MPEPGPAREIDLFVKVLPHAEGLPLPAYQTAGASGFDLVAACREDVVLKPLERALVPTGLSFELPQGFEAQIRPRSGLAIKHGITLLNTPGTIDADYRGEVQIILVNLGQADFRIQRGMRIAQAVIGSIVKANLITADNLSATSRGSGGFGHTGH